MSRAKTVQRMTADEFLVWQLDQDCNYELVDGVPVLTPKAMTGASRRHDTITVNILTSLRNQLRGSPCRPHTDDIAIRNPNGNVRRPDILVDCRSEPDRSMEVSEPRVLVEVLSPSTMRFDRFQKVEEYKAHSAVAVVLLVDSEAPRVIVWRRGVRNVWASLVVEELGASISLPEIGATLTLADIYDDAGLPTEA
ncbi:Uma2 family endonuclease [Aureimonas sp. SA4125]|uniref:Uma2 family endonuclease n=1 Tax=Aureimonas sp. SA4125 TaxID=2826993 RepID=UPI001CC5E26C|nr:Uma2 family endonuclease [Aureimonas sp. SA4125]